MLVTQLALAGEQEFAGNYELVSATRKILETGQTEDTFGKKPKGLAMYGKDGHFIILITYDGRPRPESIEQMTDQQRADLHRTMTAYGGTYTFDGSKVVHHLDLSWNEVWANWMHWLSSPGIVRIDWIPSSVCTISPVSS